MRVLVRKDKAKENKEDTRAPAALTTLSSSSSSCFIFIVVVVVVVIVVIIMSAPISLSLSIIPHISLNSLSSLRARSCLLAHISMRLSSLMCLRSFDIIPSSSVLLLLLFLEPFCTIRDTSPKASTVPRTLLRYCSRRTSAELLRGVAPTELEALEQRRHSSSLRTASCATGVRLSCGG
jgi:hypothetical protein